MPESKTVHSHCGRIFDRNGDADIDITRQHFAVQNAHVRKFGEHMEDRVFPYVEIAELNDSLFKRIRIRAANSQTDHPWKNMNDAELLRSAGLYKTDPTTGKSGITLAGILLLGKDTTIINALPQHRTDAILRVENLDRYDDRDFICTNLIDSFDRLMAFIAKHLPDKFHLEGVHSVNLRNRLFREVVSNLLIHRAYMDRFPAKLIIQRDQVYTENWCYRAAGVRSIPSTSPPIPKTPRLRVSSRDLPRGRAGIRRAQDLPRQSLLYPGLRPAIN